ncbi:LrgB family protein [Bacillus sp. EB106-08-02-XG196]|jgi:predicted murein hydrolase (TIGR00659 family)|uniref:LrgB family protein n=1 Tax=Bacillus sp. EB106-08-02-XG196 TaxID=2737049 RepID=UPI0015C475E9|nr:LrgB family protein [Bacillus sp. EB106-08-02-XG196]NWQ40320.1 LrgB family protein [Bacillus sp. EB106-08-02-XG196]
MAGLTLFNISLTIFIYIGARGLYRHFTNPFTTPVLLATIIVIIVLRAADITYVEYTPAKESLTYLLGPATVALAVPMYKNRFVIKEKALQVLSGLTLGCFATIASAIGISKLLNFSEIIQRTSAVKAVTTPVAIEIVTIIGGDPSLAAVLVITAGIFGASFGSMFLTLFKIHDPISRGLGIGTVSHGIGTSQAAAEGTLQGAVSSVAIGAAAILTSIILPIIYNLL